jgi:uncharacterized membrane protein YdbT with pleckstrin-like domain
VRPKISRLAIPTLILAAVSFSLAFFAEQLAAPEMEYWIWAGIAIAGMFWFLPLLSWLFSHLELTNARLIYRFGFLGLRKRKVPLVEISSLEINRPKPLGGKVISILTVAGDELMLTGYARTKLLAAEIERLARSA